MITEKAEAELRVITDKIVAHSGSLARELIGLREYIPLGAYPLEIERELRDTLSLLAYAVEHPTRRKRTKMDVQKMIADWLPLVKQLSLAHDVDEKDAASSRLDELILPILAAPVGQIRQFYRGLVDAMKADPQVPWAVWKLFEFWGVNVLDKISREEVVGLKKELAGRIAEMSVDLIPREQWLNSLVGALQWRSPEKLEQIEAALESGVKPSLVGKESCLFMRVGEHEVML